MIAFIAERVSLVGCLLCGMWLVWYVVRPFTPMLAVAGPALVAKPQRTLAMQATSADGDDDILHLDYESKSRTNLITDGVYNYARCSSTKILMFSWAFNDEDFVIWLPGMPFPDRIKAHFAKGRPRSVHAHNAAFERLMTWYVLFNDVPELADMDLPPIDMFYCTAAQARLRALPGALEDLGRCLRLKVQKDKRGKDLIKFFCIPQKNYDAYKRLCTALKCAPVYAPPVLAEDGTIGPDEISDNFVDPARHPKEFKLFISYCLDDGVVERDAARYSHPMTDTEFANYVISEKINDRGLKVDHEFAARAMNYAEAERDALNAEVHQITEGAARTAKSHASIKNWLSRWTDEESAEYVERLRKDMTRYITDRRTGETEVKTSTDKSVRHNILSREAEIPGTYPLPVIELMEVLDEAGRSSISKYEAMVKRHDPETSRVCGAYMFAGASQTQRDSSKGLQVHNFVRRCEKEPLKLRRRIMDNEHLGDGVLDLLASMLRPSIIADTGMTFVCGDWSSIEARVLPWLTLHPAAEKILDIFRAGDDVYKVAAADIFGIRVEGVDDHQRQVGKVAVLSLGYQGGVRAFQALARNYRLQISDEMAETVKEAWRHTNPWARQYWAKLEATAMKAVRSPGNSFQVGRVYYHCIDNNGFKTLYAILPDGTTLSYPDVRIDVEENGPGRAKRKLSAIKANWHPKADEIEWPRIDLYGGLFAENNTQATAAAVLRLFRARVANDTDLIMWAGGEESPMVGHTHDEGLLEVLAEFAERARERTAAHMLTAEPWMQDLPLDAEIWIADRYGKHDGVKYRGQDFATAA